MRKLLVIDNYDSFTFNLVQMFMLYDLSIKVHRNDMITIKQIEVIKPDYILVSPGPKDPENAGISTLIIKTFYKRVPILGVCLGMQCINEAFGGITVQSLQPMHGKTSMIVHNDSGIFKGMPLPFRAARYHSLMAKLNDSMLTVTARTPDGTIMGLSHNVYPLHGVQFHPESFLTENGQTLVKNFLNIIKR